MKKLLFTALIMMSVASLYACDSDDDEPLMPDTNTSPTTPTTPAEGEGETTENENNNQTDTETDAQMKITITANGTSFIATLDDTDAAKTFAGMLPMTIDMADLNSNEKYHYLSQSLPTSSHRPGTIHAGDLMLYGNSCVVLFYETFSSSYSYTRLGAIDNADGLAEALGRGSVNVTFEKSN